MVISRRTSTTIITKYNPNTNERATVCKFNISKTISMVNAKKKLIIKSGKKVIGLKYVKDQKELDEKSLRILYKHSVASGVKSSLLLTMKLSAQ